MKNYAVIRTDKMFGTDNRTGLYSVKYFDSTDKAAELENGCVVKLGALIDKTVKTGSTTSTVTSREIYKATDVKADTKLTEVVIVAAPEVEYDERIRDLDDYINKADVAARAYTLSVGCMFGLTEQGFTAKPAKGNIIELAAGNKLKPVATATSGATTVGVVDAVEKVGRYTYYVVRVTG